MHHRIARLGVTAAAAGLLAAATAATAYAGPLDDSFLSQLGGAGMGVGDPATAESLGRSVCPMLTEPAGKVASVAAPLTGLTSGRPMPPEMAQMFTQIAVSMYCPQMMSQLASGHLPDLPQIPGMSMPGGGLPGGVPGLGLPGDAPGSSIMGPAIPIPGLVR